jgi:hypothetical protein
MAISNGYAGQVKGGIGWVEVSRCSDPLDYPYRVKRHPPQRNLVRLARRDLGLRDARWLAAQALGGPGRGGGDDAAVQGHPEQRGQRLGRHQPARRRRQRLLPLLQQRAAHDDPRDEWLDSTRRRIKFFEVWYRVPAEVVVMQVSPTRRIMFDENNPLHQAAVRAGACSCPRRSRARCAWRCSPVPHRLIDVGTTKRNFPYIPFFAFRDDEDRAVRPDRGDDQPAGRVQRAPPDDSLDAARAADHGRQRRAGHRVQHIADLVDEAGRPDFMAVMNPSRKNPTG